MRDTLKMPTPDELAELSHAELNACVQLAFDQWVKATRQGENKDEKKAIHRAYDNEQLTRLRRINEYLKHHAS